MIIRIYKELFTIQAYELPSEEEEERLMLYLRLVENKIISRKQASDMLDEAYERDFNEVENFDWFYNRTNGFNEYNGN